MPPPPHSVLKLVFEFLLLDRAQCEQVNKEWYSISTNAFVWYTKNKRLNYILFKNWIRMTRLWLAKSGAVIELSGTDIISDAKKKNAILNNESFHSLEDLNTTIKYKLKRYWTYTPLLILYDSFPDFGSYLCISAPNALVPSLVDFGTIMKTEISGDVSEVILWVARPALIVPQKKNFTPFTPSRLT